MIKVAFFGKYSKEWMGGVNYLSNLLLAISCLEDRKIEPIVFLGNKTDLDIIKKFQPYAEVVQDSLFDKRSLKWFTSIIFEVFFKTSFLKTRLFKKYSISVLSHSGFIHGNNSFTIVNWIPDFQHIQLPNMFSNKELRKRDLLFFKILLRSHKTIVSSYNAYEDCISFSPEFADRIRVLQFVSQPDQQVFGLDKNYVGLLEKKYHFKGQFIYLPNQFWKHKNHELVFKAIKVLKDHNIEVLILCTGNTMDFRHPEYIVSLKRYIEQNDLHDNIKILGLVDYIDVLYFIRYSVTVINPSLFEGWSSTVEECKSIGKNMILSDIKVHREQKPPDSLYFNPYDLMNLVEVLKEIWLKHIEIPNKECEKHAKYQLSKRTLYFASNYQDIIQEAVEFSKTNTLK
jgi:glycosyltransferase involved in cell wall biosynthesis